MKREGFICFLFSFLFYGIAFGYDSKLSFEQPVSFTQSYQRVLGYESNPVLYADLFGENKYFFRIGAGRFMNEYRRIYDPSEVRNYALVYDNLKSLSERNLIATSVSYYRSDLFHQYRSLEKTFYDNYFSIIDTTVGNFVYDGPVLTFLDVFVPIRHLYMGFLVNYGVERGLKDVFTKCETIARNFDVSWGTGLRFGGVFISAYGKYINNQRKYEAVKEYQDANVSTFYGFNVIRVESPRTTVRKNYYSEGFEFGGHCQIESGRGVSLSGSFSEGSRYSDIDVGSPSRPLERGYWVRNGNVLEVLAKKRVLNRYGVEIYYRFSTTEDWAESSEYHVVILENDEKENFYGFGVEMAPSKKLFLSLKLGYGEKKVDYVEYNSKFSFMEGLQRRSVFVSSRYELNQLFRLRLEGSISRFEPYFYWDCKEMKSYGFKVGLERLTVYGYSGVSVGCSLIQPLDKDKNIKSLSVEFTLSK